MASVSNYRINRENRSKLEDDTSDDIDINLIWKIPDFSRYYLDLIGQETSAIFHGGSNDKPAFRFVLYPLGDSIKDSEYISLRIYSTKLNGKTFMCYSGIVNAKNKFTRLRTNHKKTGSTVIYFHRFLKRSQLYSDRVRYLQNDTLRVYFQARLMSPNSSNLRCLSPNLDLDPDAEFHLTELKKDMKRLLKEGYHSDVTLISGEASFKVNKCILAARSEVFSDILRRNVNSNCLDLGHIPQQVLKKMLLYIYAGEYEPEADTSSSETIALWKAGNEFGLAELQSYTVDHLMKDMSLKNAVECLTFANTYNIGNLRDRCVDLLLRSTVNITEMQCS